MILPINHIKTSSVNKDTITSNSVSDFNSYRGIQLYQKCLNRDENKYVQCYITYIIYLTIKEMFHMIIKREAE